MFWVVRVDEMLPRLVLRLCTQNFKMIMDSTLIVQYFHLIKLPLSGV